MQRARHLFQSSIIVIIAFALGKLTGLLRTRLVGQAFGTSAAFDAFTAANQLPEVFFIVIAGGSLAAAFIPVYTDYLGREVREVSTRLANTVLNLVIILLGSLCLVGAILAPWLTENILVPDFSPELQLMTAQIMRIILLQTVLFGISGVLSSILNSHQHFTLPALAPIALDIGYIVGLFLFVPSMGIFGLAWGTVVGSILHIAIQIPALIRYRYRYMPVLALRLRGIREVVRLMGPRIVTLGVTQVVDLFVIRLASGLATGATSAYFYAYSLMQLPETLFGTAIALVVFPTMAELYNAGDMEGLKRTAANALGIIWSLTIPAAVGMAVLGRQVIALLLEGGAFSAASTQLVYTVLLAFSVRIVSEATLEIVARLFYARHNTLTPMFAYAGWLVVTVGLAYLTVDSLSIAGLALATTIGFTLLSTVLFILNWRELGGLEGPRLARSLGRTLAATAVMSLVLLFTQRLSDNILLSLAAGVLLGGGAYVIVVLLLGGREIRQFLQLIRQRTI